MRPAQVADGVAELQVRWPSVPIVFCETRKLAEEWTYRYLAAAYSWARDEASAAPSTSVDLTWPGDIGSADQLKAPPAPLTSEVRAWARAQGITVPDRGRLRPEVHAAWREAGGVIHRRASLWCPASNAMGYIVLMSNATPPVPRSVQRSFRLSAATAAQLDEVARGSDETRNSLVERLLMEALRRERHPMITFRTTGSGLRVAGLLGTRLDVHRVIETVKGEGGDASAAAAYLSSDETWVRAAIDYYADFTAEIDHRLADEARFSSAERDRWQRAQMLVS